MSDTVVPRFYMMPVEDPDATRREGRPIFKDVEMVEVMIPGDRLTRPHFIVEDQHRQRWPDVYAAFKRGAQQAMSGTPIEQWPIMTTSRVAEMKAIGIFTVESLADLSDAQVRELGPGAMQLREQARAFLERASSGAVEAAQAARIAELEAKIERLAQMQAGMAAPAPSAPDVGAELRDVNDLSDEQLRAFIERETGDRPGNRASRQTLIARAAEIAQRQQMTEAA
jgi:hypothetical protein